MCAFCFRSVDRKRTIFLPDLSYSPRYDLTFFGPSPLAGMLEFIETEKLIREYVTKYLISMSPRTEEEIRQANYSSLFGRES